MPPKRSVDYVQYASFRFISRYRESQGTLPTGILYNKCLTLLNRELFNIAGTDMRLPHCWYRWGDEVVRHGLTYLQWDHGDPRETRVSYVGPERFPANRDEVMSLSDDFVDRFIAMYSGPEGAEMAVDEVYADAPFPFQNDFRRLRENLRIARRNLPVDNHPEMVRTLFEDAMRAFPRRSFPHIDDQVEEFTTVFGLALDSGLPADRLQDMSESFWFYFCYHLRLHRRCHANIRPETLCVWKARLPEALEDYEQRMQNYAHYLKPGGGDPVTDRLLCERRRVLDRIDGLMDAMCGGDAR